MTDPFWFTDAGARNVNPNPEVGELETAAECAGSVLDFGCGFGRMAPALVRSQGRVLGGWYLGVDPVESRVDRARSLHPEGTFIVMESAAGLCVTFFTVLARNVLLHVVDEDIEATLGHLARVAGDRLVICEHLGRHWRGSCDWSYNREREDYSDILKPLGFSCAREVDVNNPRYGAPMTTLVFKRADT